MLNKKINAYSLFVFGVLGIVLGILLITNGIKLVEILIYLLGSLIILIGVTNILRKREKVKFDIFIKSFINIIFGFIIILLKEYLLSSISIVFGAYLFLISLTNFISYFIYRYNKYKERLSVFLLFLFNFSFFLIFFFSPKVHVKYVLMILEIYLILYGIKNIFNFITVIMPEHTANRIKNHIEIPLPIFISAILPRHLIRLINEQLEENIPTFNYNKKEVKPNLEVFIHLAKSGSASFGHMELAFRDKIISYGNYNKHSRRLFDAVGDGIILVADKEEYMKYCVQKKDRFLISFGIALTKKQEEQLENTIKNLFKDTIPYYSDAELVDKKQFDTKDIHDMSSDIYRFAHGKFYKITKGKYKTFFVLKNNCALFAGQILKTIGKNVVSFNGMICPGTYYDYLNNRFMMKNTNVVTRKLYTKDSF